MLRDMTSRVTVRLPAELVRQLDVLVPSTHASRSDAVRRSIELCLYRRACGQDAARYADAPMADDEMTLADDPEAWSGTPAW